MALKKQYHHLVRDEGGRVDHKDDPGGKTVCGLTIKTMKRLGLQAEFDRLWELVPEGSIKVVNLSAEVQELLNQSYDAYFAKSLLPKWSAEVKEKKPWIGRFFAFLLFQFSPKTATIILQRALNMVTYDQLPLKVDGIWGQLSQLRLATVAHGSAFKEALVASTFVYYSDRCVRSSSARSFYDGWMNRLLKWKKDGNYRFI